MTTAIKHEMAVMDHTGDTKVIWDPDNADEVAAARAQFEALRKKGFAAFRVRGKDGEKGAQITAFDPQAEKLILVPQMVGG